MKSFFCSFILILTAIALRANPIFVGMTVDRISFSATGWSISCKFSMVSGKLDSIIVKDGVKSYAVKKSVVEKIDLSVYPKFTIGTDSFESPLNWETLPSKLQIIAYSGLKGYNTAIPLNTDDRPLAQLPVDGYSWQANEFYSLNGSPYALCKEGSCGFTLTGKVYGHTGAQLDQGIFFLLYSYSGEINKELRCSNGTYSISLPAGGTNTINGLYHTTAGISRVEIEPISVSGLPGATITQDIRLKSDLTPIREQARAEAYCSLAQSGSTLAFAYAQVPAKAEILLYTAAGQKIGSRSLTKGDGRIEIGTEGMAAGAYHYALAAGGKVLSSGNFFVKK